MKPIHRSVLLKEVLETLVIRSGETYIDATLGGGGHTKSILELEGKVFGVDVDPDAIRKVAKDLSLKVEEGEQLIARGEKATLVQGNFNKLKEIANRFGVWEASGILFDLGWSSLQMESKGLSFLTEKPLDMRLDPNLGVSAADLINSLPKEKLDELFTKYGEESNSRRIASAVSKSRIKQKILTTKQLASIVERVVPRRGRIHPATKVFQALRIVVNSELENLEEGLLQAESLLKPGGRLVVISFHSLEDRFVKNFLNNSRSLNILNKKPIIPGEEEVRGNPRARSAKMRIAEKQYSVIRNQ